jgi:hypothetical protein
MTMRICVVFLLKVVDQSSTLGMKILRSIYGWTHYYQRMCSVSFLKTWPRSYVFFHLFLSFNIRLVVVLSRGIWPWIFFSSHTCLSAEFCNANKAVCILNEEAGAPFPISKNKTNKARVDMKLVTTYVHGGIRVYLQESSSYLCFRACVPVCSVSDVLYEYETAFSYNRRKKTTGLNCHFLLRRV